MTTTVCTLSALADLDALLGSTEKAHRSSTPRSATLAIMCHARAQKLPDRTVRLWLNARCSDAIKALIEDDAAFGKLIVAARKRVAQSDSLDGRVQMRLTAARCIVGALLSPRAAHLGVSAASDARARHAVAILAPEFLKRAFDDGINTIVMSAPMLAAQMGCAKATASTALTTAAKAGYIRTVGTRHGSAQRWALSRMPQQRSDVAYAHFDLVDALVDNDPESPFVEVLHAASHAAVTYGETFVDGKPVNARVGHFAWLVGLVDEVGVDPAEVGMSKQGVASYRKRWMAAIAEGDTITSGLDAYAAAHGSDFLRDAARDAYEAAGAARKTGTEAVKERRAQVRANLAAFLGEAPIPGVRTKITHRNEWVEKMVAAVQNKDITEDSKADLVRALAAKMKVRDYGAMTAVNVAVRIIGGWPERVPASYVAGALLEEHPVPRPEVDVTERSEWVQTMAAAVESAKMPLKTRSGLPKSLAAEMVGQRYPVVDAINSAVRIAGGWPQGPFGSHVANALLKERPVPTRDDAVAKRNAWVEDLASAVKSLRMPERIRTDLCKTLTAKMKKRGYPESVAVKVAGRIAGLDAEQVAA